MLLLFVAFWLSLSCMYTAEPISGHHPRGHPSGHRVIMASAKISARISNLGAARYIFLALLVTCDETRLCAADTHRRHDVMEPRGWSLAGPWQFGQVSRRIVDCHRPAPPMEIVAAPSGEGRCRGCGESVMPRMRRHGPSFCGACSGRWSTTGARHGPSFGGACSGRWSTTGARHGPSFGGACSGRWSTTGARHGCADMGHLFAGRRQVAGDTMR